ncbi:Regulator of nonsense transcripts 3B [Sparganum proliferum]
MTEEKFIEMIQPLPDYDYFRFCPPDPTLGLQSYCRAYLNFLDPQSVFIFRERFSDYVFVDEEGNEASAIVEYAVFQGTPSVPSGDSTRAAKRVDKRQGTIDEDPEYRSFLASLAGTTTATTSTTTPSTATMKSTTTTTTTTTPAVSNAVTTSAPIASTTNPVKSESTERKQTPWEAMLETIKQREEASEAQTVTPLIAYLNQRLERRKRHAAEDAKSGGGQKGGAAKSAVGFRSSAAGKSNRVQVASRRMAEFGRRRTNSRSSPQVVVTSTTVSGNRDVSVKGDSQRKLSETSSIGGKRNTDVGGKPGEKMGSNRPARKTRRRVSGPETSTAVSAESAAAATSTAGADESARSGGSHLEPEESDDRPHQRQRREKVKPRLKTGSKPESAGDQQAADSGGRQWGTTQRAQNFHSDGRFSNDPGDIGGADEGGGGGGYPEPSRGRGRFTASRGRRGGGGGRPQHPPEFPSRHEKGALEGDDQEASARDSQPPPPRGGGPPGRGYRGGPRSFTASPRGRGGGGHRP